MFSLTSSTNFSGLKAAIEASIHVDLFTVLAVDRGLSQLKRVYTNAPQTYLIDEVWPLSPSLWQRRVFLEGKYLLCKNQQELKEGFRDHAQLLAQGYCGAIALPLFGAGPRIVCGVVNLLMKYELDRIDVSELAHNLCLTAEMLSPPVSQSCPSLGTPD